MAGLIAISKALMTWDGRLMWSGQLAIATFSLGYLGTLMRVCYWVLEEKSQDRSIMWAFAIFIVGGIVPILVALFGRNHTRASVAHLSGEAVDDAVKFEVRHAVEKAQAQPLIKNQASAQLHRQAQTQEHFSRALEYENRDNPDKAIGEYTQAIAASGHNAMAYYNRAALLVKMGKRDEAQDDLKMVIALAGDTEVGNMAKRAMEQIEGSSKAAE